MKTQDLTEMANLNPKTTGFPYYIWAGPPPASHGHRIKVVNEPGRIDPQNSFSISIEDKPRVVAGKANIPTKDLNSIIEWVKLNKDILLRHARMEIDDDELKDNLQMKTQVIEGEGNMKTITRLIQESNEQLIERECQGLEETSLGRVWQGVNDPDIAMAFFSAFRSYKETVKGGPSVDVSLKENLQRTKILKGLLATNRWGYSMVKGAWRDADTGAIVSELSFVVRVKGKDEAGKLKGFVRKLTQSKEAGVRDGGDPQAGTFDQDAVVFKPVDSDEAMLITNKGDEFSIGKFHPNVIADNFTKVKNASFAFKEEAYEHKRTCWSEHLKNTYRG